VISSQMIVESRQQPV